MTTDLTHYLPILVRSREVSEWERDFVASLIRQTRRGRALTGKQAGKLEKLVQRFRDANMRDDGVVE